MELGSVDVGMDGSVHERTPTQGTAEWLARRRGGIGGSEISALYRLPDGRCAHPWMSQLDLWAEKTGRAPISEPSPWEAPHLYVGRELEEPVRRMYATFSGRTVRKGVTLLRDSEAPVLLASTDGEQDCPSRPDEPGVYEGKVTTVFRRTDWFNTSENPETGELERTETVPLHYRCQTMHYLGCTGLTWGSVVAFIQGDRAPIHWRDIERHDAFISDMRERAERWWRDHVIADKEPPIDDSKATENALRRLHRKAENVALQLPAAFAAVLDRLEAIAAMEKLLKREKQRLRNIVLSTLGSATLAVIADDGRGWALRGEAGRSLRAITAGGVQRALRSVERTRPVYVPTDLGRELDSLYSLTAQAYATGQTLTAKAVHLCNLAVVAAHSIATE